MDFDEILPNLFVGSCPRNQGDIDHLKTDVGITAVLNLQTDDDFAHIRVEQYLDLFPQGRYAMGTGWMLELEVPLPPTPRATVVGHDEHFPIDNAMLG
jgi:hypothetical protein